MKKIYLLLLAACIAVSCEETPQPNGGTGNTDNNTDDEFALVEGGEDVLSIEAVNVRKVARVVGMTPKGEDLPNPNNTLKRFGMSSTDFGNMWDAGDGTVWAVFGDNFNNRGGDWLSNAVAITKDRNLDDGLYYDSMLWDEGKDKRMEIITSRQKTGQHPDGSDYEITCIPTGGMSVPEGSSRRQYINYMSVNNWKPTGENDYWTCNYSEIVYSDDFGDTWTRSGVKWDGTSNFVQIAYEVHEGTVYMWGTKSGRHEKVHVARVAQEKVLDKNEYEYWNGKAWVKDESQAAPVTNGHVSEFSVRYNSYYKRWIMLYLSVNQRKLVYRDAASPEGEWSGEKIILNDTYGPSIHPWFCDGRDFWFVSSTVTSDASVTYDTWHIFLYHAKLRADADGFNMVWEGGFENEPTESINYKTFWEAPHASTSYDAHEGKVSCKLTNKDEGVWKDACTQKIIVHKNTDYVITGYAKSSLTGYEKAYLGARLPVGGVKDKAIPLNPDQWTEIRVEFNSGDNTEIELFFGAWGHAGLTVNIDDIHMTIKNLHPTPAYFGEQAYSINR